MRLILGSHTAIGLADPTTGTVLARRELVQPTFLAVSPRGDRLYAVGEDPDGPGRLYCVELTDSGLGELVADVPSGDTGPCHVSVHPTAAALLVSHYTGGSLGVMPLTGDGGLSGPPLLLRHHGRGPEVSRQESAHVHQAVTDPSGRWVVACDLGADAAVVYRCADGGLARHGSTAFRPGQGVRHLAFAPDGNRAYVAAELSSQLVACDWDAATGTLTPRASIDTATGQSDGRNYPGAVVVSRDGAHVYVTNRGEDSIAVIDADTVTRVGSVATGGAWPRDACASPAGDALFVANEHSGIVTGFALRDGTPVPTGLTIAFDGVTSVLAIPLPAAPPATSL